MAEELARGYSGESYWERRFWQPDIETMPRKEIRRLQGKKLHHELVYAYENAPFYHELYDKEKVDVYKIRTIEDFQKYVPLVNKDTVRVYRERTGDPFGGICCVPVVPSTFSRDIDDDTEGRLWRSTGSTGIPTISINTRKDIHIATTIDARVWWRYGARPGDRASMMGNFGYISSAQCMGKALRYIGVIIHCDESGAIQSPETLDAALSVAKMLGCNCFFGTAAHLRLICSKYEAKGKTLKDDFPRAKFYGQTPEMSKAMMEYESKVLGCPVTNYYGLSETLWMGGSCIQEGNSGVWQHMSEDFFIVEIFPPGSDKAVDGAEFGEIVITSLDQEAMAYIRWHSEDWAQVRWDPCLYCGYTHIQCRPRGRVVESVNVKGKMVTIGEIEDVVYAHPESRPLPIQMIREEPQPQDKLRVRICYNPKLTKAPEQYKLRLKEEFERETGVDTLVDLITPEEVRLLVGWKFERVVKEKRQS
jgi:phenylacetate-CoA ligase